MSLSKAIGGFFELELYTNSSNTFHLTMHAVNSGRNALLLLILSKGYSKIYMPYYTCGVVVDTLNNNNIDISFYNIDKNFEIIDLPFDKNSAILYNNYFGIKDKYIYHLSLQYSNIIVDNAQAFYSTPQNNLDTFYSPRKFFGLSDGGFLFSQTKINIEDYPRDNSYDRCSHLLKRIDLDPEKSYNDFKTNDIKLNDLQVKKMSRLTQVLIKQINYPKISQRRRKNFNFLHDKLSIINELNFNIEPDAVPMIYPLLLSVGKSLKKKLIENRVFVATYWPDVLGRVSSCSYEAYLVNNLIAIPIDQRYDYKDMEQIINIINH